MLNPWARLQPKRAAEIAERLRREVPAWVELEPAFQSTPTLDDSPLFFAERIEELASIRERLARDPAKNAGIIPRIDALSGALSGCAADCASLVQRMMQLAQSADAMFFAMDFKFLFDQHEKAFFHRVSGGRRHAWMPVATICWLPKPA